MHTEHLDDGRTRSWWSSQDADRSPFSTRPVTVRPGAKRMEWRGNSRELSELDAHDVNRYGVTRDLAGAGIDAACIEVYNGPYEDSGVYWVVLLDDRRVTLTDDTEDRVVYLEGLWPFAATFSGPAGSWTEVHESVEVLLARIVAWCTPPDGRRTIDGQPGSRRV